MLVILAQSLTVEAALPSTLEVELGRADLTFGLLELCVADLWAERPEQPLLQTFVVDVAHRTRTGARGHELSFLI